MLQFLISVFVGRLLASVGVMGPRVALTSLMTRVTNHHHHHLLKNIKDLTGGDVPSTHSQVLVLTPPVSTPQPTLLSHQREGAVAWNFNKLFNIGKKNMKISLAEVLYKGSTIALSHNRSWAHQQSALTSSVGELLRLFQVSHERSSCSCQDCIYAQRVHHG